MKLKCILLGCMIELSDPHFFSMQQQPITAQLGFRLPHCWGFYITHIPVKTPLNGWSTHHRGYLLTQYTTNTRDKYPCLWRDPNPRSQLSIASELHLRPLCHQDWLNIHLPDYIVGKGTLSSQAYVVSAFTFSQHICKQSTCNCSCSSLYPSGKFHQSDRQWRNINSSLYMPRRKRITWCRSGESGRQAIWLHILIRNCGH